LTKKAGEKVKGKRGGRHPCYTLFKPLGKAHGEEDHICADPAGGKAQGVRFQAPRFIYGVSLSPFAFPLFPAPLAHWLTSKQVAEDLPVHRLKMLNSKHTTMLAQGNALV